MTYEELMAFALKHYNEGGDGLYECWDRHTFDEYVHEFGPITERDALKMFGVWDAICKDRMEDDVYAD